jgi:cytoskeletal protein RodZ
VRRAEPVTDSPNPDPTSALRALGQRLRQGREEKGLALPELAGRLNMGVEQLRALESGDGERLPEPVFVVAQARRVANNLGITIDEPLQQRRATELFQTKPPKVEELNLRGFNAADAANDQASEPPHHGGKRALGGVALVAGIVAALVAGGRQLALTFKTPASPPPASSPAAGPTQAKPVSPATAQPPAAGSKPPAGNELLLSSSQPSWLEVKSPAGAVLFRGTFKGERRFPLNGGLAVLAGRPDLVLAQIGSGASQPLGRIDQVSWKRFKPAAAAPAPAP